MGLEVGIELEADIKCTACGKRDSYTADIDPDLHLVDGYEIASDHFEEEGWETDEDKELCPECLENGDKPRDTLTLPIPEVEKALGSFGR
jgi:hypothetical protein